MPPRLGFFDDLKAGFENDASLKSSRRDYTEGLSGKRAPKYVKKYKREALNAAAANLVPMKFPGGKGALVKPGTTLLKAARSNGMKLPSDCLRGECRTCACRMDGRVVLACSTVVEKPRYTKAINVSWK